MFSNRDRVLAPRTRFDGPALEFDFPSFQIGVAEYDEGPTGCTVFIFSDDYLTAVDARGGSVGLSGEYEVNRAICLAGGSLPGMEAATGVSAALWSDGGYSLDVFPLVSGAIIFDYGARDNRIYPDMALGEAALRAARPGHFPLGARGAGRSAGCGAVFDFAQREPSGQGGAFRAVGEIKVAVFTVVNALGVVLDREGRTVRGMRDPRTGQRAQPGPELERRIANGEPTDPRFGNTTLTVLITNQKLQLGDLTQLARQTHSSMARAIFPFHTLMDGDVLFAVSTGEAEAPQISVAALGMVASDLAWDAILASAPANQ